MTSCISHPQYHDVDGIGHEDDHVGTATRHLYLRTHIDVKHGESAYARMSYGGVTIMYLKDKVK